MPTSKLDKKISIPANSGFGPSVSGDAQAWTVLFDNMFVDLPRTKAGGAGTLGQTAIQTKLFTVNFPFTSDGRSVAMILDVRGFVNTDPDVIVRLIVCAGNAAEVVDLSAALGEKVELKGTTKEQVIEERPGLELGNFQCRIAFAVQVRAKNPVCQITLILVAERNNDAIDAGGALLAVDSLDLSIAAEEEVGEED